MNTPWTQILRKIDDYRWELPTSYKSGMRVPGLIYADEKMLRQIVEEQALEQVANSATLPGIVGRALAMPDIHWGYGFPVGGVAAFDVNEGIISPGAVGFDLNCLPRGAQILQEFGYHRPIEAFEQLWQTDRIICLDGVRGPRGAAIAALLRQERPGRHMLELTTETGRRLVATADHPLLTPRGMVAVGEIRNGESVALYPFEGVPYEPVGDDILLAEEDVARLYPSRGGNGLGQVLGALKRRGLIPMSLDHPKLPLLIKLMGFVHGDGSIQFLRSGHALVSFYAQPEDLEAIRQDVQQLGFRPSRIYRRRRHHRSDTPYGTAHFSTTECMVHSGSTALAVLLHGLGVPVGNKAGQDFDAPDWLNRAPRWMKRLYLAALFGAELTAPSTVTGRPHNFYDQIMSMNKRPRCAESGRRYMQRIQAWLQDFGVESVMLAERQERSGESVAVRLRLMISARSDSLIRLWTTIGFEYNTRKRHLGCVAAQYLRLKDVVLDDRRHTTAVARDMRAEGYSPRTISHALLSRYMKPAFIAHSLYSTRRHVRIGGAFMGYESFLREKTEGLGETGRVWDRVVRVLPASYDGPVYDLTVNDHNHNFIANGFVVSNCGVRLIRTGLDEPEVKERLQPLVDALFHAVPSGVGATGRVKLDPQGTEGVLRHGARWAVGQGYGWADDLEVIESGGALPQADPDAVSPEAKKRGRAQIGTLGSGNHFLEVQVVDEIFDAAAAEAMGLTARGQVVVFVHCGSRGLGHQVCTDYLRVAERSAREHGIALVDRQLACMPFQSDEGQRYVGAMSAAANFAWANRQVITHWVRGAFERVFAQSAEALGMALVYDVSHNIAKVEEYVVEGRRRELVVHRKGATRAFPAGHPDVPERYRAIGQPVLIPGDMGRYSFIAIGTERAVRESFGSTCHGAGRVMGRKQAVRTLAGRDVGEELRRQGIIVRAQDRGLLAEEAPQAYKDVADVVEICHQAGISRRVVRTRPIGVVKG